LVPSSGPSFISAPFYEELEREHTLFVPIPEPVIGWA